MVEEEAKGRGERVSIRKTGRESREKRRKETEGNKRTREEGRE